MNNKLISVIIPAYNTEEFIDKCLQSVVKQTYRNLQIIVVNDGSEDGTEDIILRYARNDKRIEYYKQKIRVMERYVRLRCPRRAVNI